MKKYKFRKETNIANYVGHLKPGKHLRWRAKEQNVREGGRHLGSTLPATAKGNRAAASLAQGPAPSVHDFTQCEMGSQTYKKHFSSVSPLRR